MPNRGTGKSPSPSRQVRMSLRSAIGRRIGDLREDYKGSGRRSSEGGPEPAAAGSCPCLVGLTPRRQTCFPPRPPTGQTLNVRESAAHQLKGTLNNRPPGRGRRPPRAPDTRLALDYAAARLVAGHADPRPAHLRLCGGGGSRSRFPALLSTRAPSGSSSTA